MLKEIELVTKRGFQIIGFEGDSITKEIQKVGEYDANTLDALDQILGLIKPDVSLDVGANIGNHSLLISRHSRQLVAFEPVEFIFNVLDRNIRINKLNNVCTFNLALSDHLGTSEICIPQNGNLSTSSINRKSECGESLKISLVRGDDFLVEKSFNQRVDFIKIDVEGHEPEVLQGLSKTVISNQPLILLEWKDDRVPKIFSDKDLYKTLFGGYHFYSLTNLDNKKVHHKTLLGLLSRVAYKFFYRKWCLSAFDSTKKYSNVLLVPQRYSETFNTFRYKERKK